LNGPVYTIAYNEQNGTIYFGGRFTATGDGSFGVSNNTQPINIKNATVICGGDLDGPSNTWLLQDNMPGFWRVAFNTSLSPTAISIRNTNYQGRGTKSFRLVSSPDQSVLTLVYANATTGEITNCSNICTLDPNNQVFQIYYFNQPVNLTGFEIDILEWYGEGGGLHGIQLFQTGKSFHLMHVEHESIFSQLPNNYACYDSFEIIRYRSVKTVGNWTSRLLSGIWEYVMMTTIPSSQLTSSTAELTLIPYIPESGYYNVTLFTPSCLPIGCSSTTSIDVKLIVMPNVSITFTITENYTEEYHEDAIYSGFVVATSAAFQPRVEITVSKTAKPPADGGDAVIYVDRVLFKPTNISNNSLSGLLQYTPASSGVQASWYGLHGKLAPGANVSDIAVISSSEIIIGGKFENETFSNIVQYDGSSFTSLPSGGLNGQVNVVLQVGNDLMVGGLFNSTASNDATGFNNLAIYNIEKRSWRAAGEGVNGEVTRLAPVNEFNSSRVHVVGRFNTLISQQAVAQNATFGNVTFGHAVWDDSIENWVSTVFVEGLVGDVVPYSLPNNQTVISFWGGNIISALSFEAFSGILITSSGISPLPIYPQSNASEVIINAACTDPTQTYQIIGGKFQFDNLNNIGILKNNAWNAVSVGNVIEVRALTVYDNILYVGSSVNSSKDQAFAVFTLSDFKTVNTLPLSASDNQIRVNSIKNRGGTDNIVVAGKFDQAGSLYCESVCLWISGNQRWSPLSNNNVSGEILSIDFIGTDQNQNILMAAGNLTFGKTLVYLAQYDFTKSVWQEMASPGNGSNQLPGPATVVLNDFKKNGQFFVAGYGRSDNAVYLRKWDGNKFRDISQGLLKNSIISQLSLVPAESQHGSSDILDASWLLLIAGDLALTSYGNVSAALYDGSTLYPYLISAGGGTLGKIFSIFAPISPGFLNGKNFLPVPLVILISVSISLAFIFILVAAGMSFMYFKRRRVSKSRS
ncbi:14004_t:CDS:2, partial [Acaulospora colombiana]